MSRELETVRDYLRWIISRFNDAGLYYGHGTDNAQDEAWYLVCGALKLPFDLDGRLLDGRLTEAERQQLEQLVERRISERVPVAYLVGEAWFAGLPFNVDERVLVPRSPLAELIDVGFQPWLGDVEPEHILDLCTGSGCIGITCGYAFEQAEIVLSDISEDALVLAQTNIEKHGQQGRTQSLLSDGLTAVSGKFDLIVSNPPYVDASDLASMPAEYHAEPEIGLASGEDGLDFTRQLLQDARHYLTDNGCLVVEVGNSWEALERAFPKVPFTWVEFERGGHGVFVLTATELEQYFG